MSEQNYKAPGLISDFTTYMWMEVIIKKCVSWLQTHTYFNRLSCTVMSYAAWAVKSTLKETVTKNVYFHYDLFYHVKPVQYSLHITFWQVMNIIATALFMAETYLIILPDPRWRPPFRLQFIILTGPKLAVIFGTLIGFIMISIIIISTTILNSPLNRYVVCNKFVFWNSFASQHTVHTQLSLATEHISDIIVIYLIVFNHYYRES